MGFTFNFGCPECDCEHVPVVGFDCYTVLQPTYVGPWYDGRYPISITTPIEKPPPPQPITYIGSVTITGVSAGTEGDNYTCTNPPPASVECCLAPNGTYEIVQLGPGSLECQWFPIIRVDVDWCDCEDPQLAGGELAGMLVKDPVLPGTIYWLFALTLYNNQIAFPRLAYAQYLHYRSVALHKLPGTNVYKTHTDNAIPFVLTKTFDSDAGPLPPYTAACLWPDTITWRPPQPP